MTSGCITPQTIVSGGQITGLTAGTAYYVGIVANPPTGYVSAESSIVGPTTTTAQLNAPTNVVLSYGTTAGSIGVTFTPSSGAPGGQTYTADACTNNLMSIGCVTPEQLHLGRPDHNPHLHPGQRRHLVLRDHHGERVARVSGRDVHRGWSAGRYQPGERSHQRRRGAVFDDGWRPAR